MTPKALLTDAANRATRYLEALPERRVSPSPSALDDLAGFSSRLQEEPLDPRAVLEELDRLGSPATVASAGGPVLWVRDRRLPSRRARGQRSRRGLGSERRPGGHVAHRRGAREGVPRLARRARAVEVWAALRSLGRTGLAQLIDRSCDHARHLADGLEAAGYRVLNDVVLNQVLVSFGTPEVTRRVIAGVQEDGTCWCGGTVWQGRTAMRISVSSWVTTKRDVDRSLQAILRVAATVQGR